MDDFIKITIWMTGVELYLRTQYIISVNKGTDDRTYIYTVGSEEPMVARESVEEIMQKINHVEQKGRTYAEDFKAKLPHAPVDDRGCPTGCRRLFYGGRKTMCEDCTRTVSCYTCWNTLMGEEP